MLTKDLLKFRCRQGRLYPSLIAATNSGEAFALAEQLLAVGPNACGLLQRQVEEQWELAGLDLSPWYGGLKKLLTDRIAYEEADAAWQEKRWLLFTAAQELRQEQLFANFSSFQEALGLEQGTSFADLAQSLYGDLPEERPIKLWPDLTPEGLLQSYNLAQVQGLLLRARHLDLKLNAASLAERRALFRALKFHQLVAEVLPGDSQAIPEDSQAIPEDSQTQPFSTKNTSEALHLRISGPLSVLNSAQSYGLRLANFFPRILACKQWQLTAELSLPPKTGIFKLELDEGLGLCSPAKTPLSYTPPEFEQFLQLFSEQAEQGWQAKPGEALLPLGRQSYCFPDFTFIAPTGQELHLELFHKWHWGQLQQRLQTLATRPARNLLIGVQKCLTKDSKAGQFLKESEWFQSNGFVFKDFPAVKSVLQLLKQHTPLC